jgi:hypothetical protein
MRFERFSIVRRFFEWWCGDLKLPATKQWIGAALLLRLIALLFAVGVALHMTRAVRKTPAPAPLSTTAPLFGVPDAEQKTIFDDLAADEPRARVESAKKFPGEPWSIEDERAAHERDRTREIAASHKINLSQAYLILDEAIREHWLYIRAPLDATVVPLKPRYR